MALILIGASAASRAALAEALAEALADALADAEALALRLRPAIAERPIPPIAAWRDALAPGAVRSTPKLALMLATAARRLIKAASFGGGIVSAGGDRLARALRAA
jgi:hypothetical protein